MFYPVSFKYKFTGNLWFVAFCLEISQWRVLLFRSVNSGMMLKEAPKTKAEQQQWSFYWADKVRRLVQSKLGSRECLQKAALTNSHCISSQFRDRNDGKLIQSTLCVCAWKCAIISGAALRGFTINSRASVRQNVTVFQWRYVNSTSYPTWTDDDAGFLPQTYYSHVYTGDRIWTLKCRSNR